MKSLSPAFYIASLLVLLSFGSWAVPQLQGVYFQALGSRLLSEAFAQAGKSGQESFACAQARTLDEKALQLATQALNALEKAHTEQVYLLLGRAHCLRGEAEQAIAAYLQYTSARPANPLGQLELGFAYERSRNLDMAIKSWVRANITADQFWTIGNKAYEAGRADDALQWLDRAIALQPGWDRPYYTKGMVYSSQGKTEQAIDTLRTASSFNPDNSEIYFHLCEVLASAQNYPDALVACNKGTKDGPFVIAAWLESAKIEEKMGNATAALAAYRKAVDESALVSSTEADSVWKRIWPLCSLGDYYIKIGELDQAESYFMKALNLDSGNQYAAYSLWSLGRIAFQKAQYTKAQDFLFRALQLKPNFYIRSQVYLVYAQIELSQRNTPEGIEYLRKAVNEHPDNQGLHLLLADTLQEAGFLEEAVKEYDLYEKKWPNNTHVQEAIQKLNKELQIRAP